MRLQPLLIIMIIPLSSYCSQSIVKEFDNRIIKIIADIKERDRVILEDAAAQHDEEKCARALFYQCAAVHNELIKDYALAIQCNETYCRTIAKDIFNQLEQYTIDVKKEWKERSLDLLQSIPKFAQAYYVTVFDDREY